MKQKLKCLQTFYANLQKLKNKIILYFKYDTIFSKYWMEYHFPLSQWYKARDKFKKPKCHFICGKPVWFFGWPAREEYINPIIDIRSSSLGWKSKYDSPRHEWDPYFAITFFRKYRIMWMWNYITDDSNDNVRSMATWEALLDYLYFDRTIDWVKENHVWLNHDKSEIRIDKNLK